MDGVEIDMDMERMIQEAYDNGYLRGYKQGKTEMYEHMKNRLDDEYDAGYCTGKADRPQGEWVPFEYGDERWHKCTVCGVADRYIEYVERPNGTTGKLVAIRNYCPNCGCRMKGADDETD